MNIKNILAIVFSVLFLIAVGVFVYLKVLPQFSLFSSSSLAVSTGKSVSQVYLNGRLLGVTPLRKDGLAYKKATLRVTSSQNVWEQNVVFTPSTETTVTLDLGTSQLFSGGDVVWLESRNGKATMSVISDPSVSQVTLDETVVGQTPLLLDISAGPHILKLAADGYQSRSLNIMARDNYKLNVASHLFLLPIPEVTALTSQGASAASLYEISSQNIALSSDFKSWAKAISYWQSTREASPSGAFTYMLDSAGALYDRGGDVVPSFPTNLPQNMTVAYLGKPNETALSSEATASFQKLLSGGATKQVKILPTGQAWLRIRNKPDGDEIGRADVDKLYNKVGEQTGWTQIIFGNNQTGWVSSAYVSEVATPKAEESQ